MCPCGNKLPADRTGSSDGLCPRCRMLGVAAYYTGYLDMGNMPKDEISLDKQRLVEERGFLYE